MKFYNILRTLTRITFVLLIASQIAFAQDEYDQYALEDSVTVTAVKAGKVATYNSIGMKLPIPLRSTPASISVIPQALINNQGGLILNDVLRNASGVNPQAGNGVHDYFVVRGFNSLDNGLVMTDGTAEPEVMFYNTYNLERIEILKGPSAFLYGNNPLSGTVNLIRKPPLFDKFLNATGAFGHFNTFRGAVDAGYGSAASGLAFRVNGLFQNSDYYRNDKQNETIAVNPTFAWRINDRSAFHADYEYVDSDYKPDSGIPLQFNVNNQKLDIVPDVDRKLSYQTPFDESSQKMQRFKGNFSSKLGKNFTIRNKFYYTDFEWISNGTLLNGAFPDPSSGMMVVSRSMTFLDNKEKLLGNQLEGLFSFNTGNVKHTVVTGVEYRQTENDFLLDFAELPFVLLENPFASETANSESDIFAIQLQTGNSTATTIAPYAINQISFSKQFQLLLGARYDNIQFERDGTDLNLATFEVTASSQDRDFTEVSPMAGVVFSPLERTSFYANTSRAFAPHSVQGSVELSPEESRQVEFGIKHELVDGKMIATVALYELEKDNIAMPDDLGAPTQTGNQRSRGLEVDIIAEPSQGWVTFFNYGYTDAELVSFAEIETIQDQTGALLNIRVDRTGNVPAFAPKHIANVWTTRQFNSGLEVGAGLRYLSSQYIDPDNVFEIDPALTLDARVSYRISNVRFTANFKNITNTETETRGFGASSIIPANPFTVLGGFDINL